jgi:hypothetical protein
VCSRTSTARRLIELCEGGDQDARRDHDRRGIEQAMLDPCPPSVILRAA